MICRKFLPFLIPALLLSFKIFSQTDTSKPLRIAVLAPLYVDSAFNDTAIKLGTINIPKYFLPGLDFYNGVMMAVDSLQKENANIEVWIYDTKKKWQTNEMLIQEIQRENVSLIIASFTNPVEQKNFAEFVFKNNIPLISATYPNDALVKNNPFFIMINPTIETHIEAIYKYVQRSFPVGKILYVTRRGTQEQGIKSKFNSAAKKTYPLKYRQLILEDDFMPENIAPFMDSTKQNVIICGSLNESFGLSLVRALNTLPQYAPVAIGMPTWDAIKQLSGEDCENVQIIFSTPYNFSPINKVVSNLAAVYKTRLNGRASDMVFKGFESMYHFSKLMIKYPTDFTNNLSDTSFKIFNDFNFQPVKLNASSFAPDYIENKKLYFITKMNGMTKSIN